MGLDFSHGDAHFSYPGFSLFRKRLMAVLGIDVEDMEGFENDRRKDMIKRGLATQRKWESLPPDDIYLLVDHSDCDGELTVQECQKIVPRLKQLTVFWNESDIHKVQADRLIASMEQSNQPR